MPLAHFSRPFSAFLSEDAKAIENGGGDYLFYGIEIPTNGQSINVNTWTNQADPPLYDERVIIFEGHARDLTPSSKPILEERGHFQDLERSFKVQTPTVTIVPLHRVQNQGRWSQSPYQTLKWGRVTGKSVYQVKYEDHPDSPEDSVDPDLYVSVSGMVNPNLDDPVYNGNVDDDNVVKFGAWCCSLIDGQGYTVFRKTIYPKTYNEKVAMGETIQQQYEIQHQSLYRLSWKPGSCD